MKSEVVVISIKRRLEQAGLVEERCKQERQCGMFMVLSKSSPDFVPF